VPDARKAPRAIGGDERERVHLGRRHALGDELCGFCGEPAQPAFLPGVYEPPCSFVISDGPAGGRKAEPASCAFAAALDRPRGRRAAARAQRRLDPLQLLAAAGAELFAAAAADDTTLRQKQVEHGSTLRRQP
jgi:hypothetical protein